MRPLLLLDVDGVLNILGDDTQPSWDVIMTGRAVADGMAYTITWSPEVIQAVLDWIDQGVEVQWLTTWGHDANTSMRHLIGMPELPVAGTYDENWAGAVESASTRSHAEMAPAAPDPLTGAWWKYDVVKRLLDEHPDRLLVWIDDELFRPTRFRRWAEAHERVYPTGPDGDLGLTQENLDEIEAGLSETAPG
jgi:hypothetical protein